MIEIRKVLCPVDMSDFSRQALQHGRALARRHDASITVLAVRPSPPQPVWGDISQPLIPDRPGAREHQERALRAFVEDAVGGGDVHVLIQDGAIVAEIVRVAEELPADVIAMGTHGLSGFERLLLGSVTERVLRKARCPVLTVPRSAVRSSAEDVTYKTIVCGVDHSWSSRRALEYATAFAALNQGCVVLVHVIEDFVDEESRFATHFDIDGCRRTVEPEVRAAYESLVSSETPPACDVRVVVRHGKPYREILRVAQEVGADLIAIGMLGRTAAELALFGSTTQHVLRQAACPVFSVPFVPPASKPDR